MSGRLVGRPDGAAPSRDNKERRARLGWGGRLLLALLVLVLVVCWHPWQDSADSTPAQQPLVSAGQDAATGQPSASLPAAATSSAAPAAVDRSPLFEEVAAPEPAEVAERFVTAWLNTAGGKKAWLARMKPWAAQNYLDAMATADPGNVWKANVNGPARLAAHPSPGQMLVHVTTTRGALAVSAAKVEGRWVVTSMDPARQ